MIKDTAIHTCNGCNKTFENDCIYDCTFNQKRILQQRSKLCRVPHTNFVTILKVYKIFLLILKDFIYFLGIMPGYTT